MGADRSWQNPSGRVCTRSTGSGKAVKTRFMASSSRVLTTSAGLGAGLGLDFLTVRAFLADGVLLHRWPGSDTCRRDGGKCEEVGRAVQAEGTSRGL